MMLEPFLEIPGSGRLCALLLVLTLLLYPSRELMPGLTLGCAALLFLQGGLEVAMAYALVPVNLWLCRCLALVFCLHTFVLSK